MIIIYDIIWYYHIIRVSHKIIFLNGAQRAADACLTGKPFGIWRGPDGKYQQKLLGTCYTLLELKSQLETRSRKTIAGYDAVITDQEHQPCALKRQRCNHLISPCNLSQSIEQHDGRCTGPAQPQEELMEDPDEGAGGPPPKAQGTTNPCLPLHSNIQTAAGLPQRAHTHCHWCWAPIQEAGQPPKGQQGSVKVQLEMAALG